MDESAEARSERHAAQLRCVHHTLDRALKVVLDCQEQVKRLQSEIDDLLYNEHSKGVERPAAPASFQPLQAPECGGEHQGVRPPATHLVWEHRDGQPVARCYDCARSITLAERTDGARPHASPILAGPPCRGSRCRTGRRRHATMRVITEHNRRGIPYCDPCGERALSVLEEQGVLYETAGGVPRPVERPQSENREAA